ncbi:MAG TPA: HNH endonuclease signature motif containing protein [Planctomycetota bacterium]|nr:HNH endonuclease signature motif containing protein [Planctomycetota bacterium]
MSRIVSASMVRKVRARAHSLCEYCKVADNFEEAEFAIDHIVARQHGGADVFENLAWSCYCCNSAKGPNLSSIDPESGHRAYLFNPRNDTWHSHFSMRDGTIIARTAKGRATLSLLRMNDAETVALRRAYFKKQLLP